MSKHKLKLEKLLEHGRKNVWHPEHDVNWSIGEKKLDKLNGEEREALRAVLSLIYYSDAQGRQILQTMCRSMDHQITSDVLLSEKAHEFFIQQMDDEDRHATGLNLLFKRLGMAPEPKAFSHLFYSKFLLADHFFDAKLILIYWYIEILAKSIFVELKERFPETFIDSLFTRIIRDEARHVGFGEVYIPAHIEQASVLGKGKMALAYYSSAAALPGLYKFGHYSKAARTLGLDPKKMFSTGLDEVFSKVRRMPAGNGFVDLKKPAEWISAFL